MTGIEGRELVVGPEKVESPYPIYLKGAICKGFGRGSREIGVPTANLPQEVADSASTILKTGVYYGYGTVSSTKVVYPMVMSYGWNPYYQNEKRSAEVHLIHEFPGDLYDEELRVVVLSYIRPELKFNSLEELIQNIKFDIEVCKNSLNREDYLKYSEDKFFIY